MKLILGDCIDQLATLDPDSVDLIVADPPYFMPAAHYNTRTQFSRNFADLGIMEHWIRDFAKSCIRVLKDTGSLYLFCDGQSYPIFYYHFYPLVKKLRPLIWDKLGSFNGYTWRHQHELILFCEMPGCKGVPTGDGDILKGRCVKVAHRQHPAEKPVDLLETLIRKSTSEGQIVCDPTMGSGSTGVACAGLGREFIGIEKEPAYYNTACQRIEKTLHKGDL